MKSATQNWINTIIGLVALLFALFFLYRQLRTLSISDGLAYLHALSPVQIVLALLATALSYLILTGYDRLSLRFLEKSLPYPKVAFAAFVSYAISKNLGISWLTGGSLRYRFYSRWGMTLVEISKLVLFNTTTFLCGFFFWGGLALLFFPPRTEIISFLRGPLLPAFGIALWAVLLLYLLICSQPHKTIRFRNHVWHLPPLSIALSQVVLGAVDVLATLGVLYLLLPSRTVSFLTLLTAYFIGEVVAILTHAPGGIGVFESTLLAVLGQEIAASALFPALLLYRLVYFFVPLVLGMILLGIDEVRDRPGSIDILLHRKTENR
ncbi:MAG: UPF0104 family protein [Nitrospirae bacterium]|nr:UPF0104 family protein [Candidatus Manganitrophaceae bacterium]